MPLFKAVAASRMISHPFVGMDIRSIVWCYREINIEVDVSIEVCDQFHKQIFERPTTTLLDFRAAYYHQQRGS
jgi:hypothetical protein